MRAHHQAPGTDHPVRTVQEELLIGTTPVYCQGVAMASKIVSEGTGPLYAPRRRGDLRKRVAEVLAALRGTS